MNEPAPGGLTAFQLGQHERRLEHLESSLTEVRQQISAVVIKQTEMKGEMHNLESTILKATMQLEEGRRADIDRLQETIKAGQRSARDIVVSLVFPILAVVIGTLILYAATKGLAGK